MFPLPTVLTDQVWGWEGIGPEVMAQYEMFLQYPALERVLVEEKNQELKCIEPENVQNTSKSFSSYMKEAWRRYYQIDR